MYVWIVLDKRMRCIAQNTRSRYLPTRCVFVYVSALVERVG